MFGCNWTTSEGKRRRQSSESRRAAKFSEIFDLLFGQVVYAKMVVISRGVKRMGRRYLTNMATGEGRCRYVPFRDVEQVWAQLDHRIKISAFKSRSGVSVHASSHLSRTGIGDLRHPARL